MDQLSTLLGDGGSATIIEVIISFALGATTGFKVATKQRIKQVQKGGKAHEQRQIGSIIINQSDTSRVGKDTKSTNRRC